IRAKASSQKLAIVLWVHGTPPQRLEWNCSLPCLGTETDFTPAALPGGSRWPLGLRDCRSKYHVLREIAHQLLPEAAAMKAAPTAAIPVIKLLGYCCRCSSASLVRSFIVQRFKASAFHSFRPGLR